GHRGRGAARCPGRDGLGGPRHRGVHESIQWLRCGSPPVTVRGPGEVNSRVPERTSMPANVYECLYLLDTNKAAGHGQTAAKQRHSSLERTQPEILASRQWDEGRLGYPIKNHKKGLYSLMYFRTEGKNLINVERDLALCEVVLRYMTLKIDPKL